MPDAKINQRASAAVLDLPSFKRQEPIFVVFNLVLLGFVLLLHTAFASFWGKLPNFLLLALGFVFAANISELVWVIHLKAAIRSVVGDSIVWSAALVNIGLAILLTAFTDHEDNPYYILLIVPILRAAFRFSLPSVIATIATTDFLTFYWVHLYYRRHPPLDPGEYFESGLTSLIFSVVGILFWAVINRLREKETRLAANLVELEKTRERLLREETLSAVGRLSSAIAHEIRNPVAMIASSLAMASQTELAREERAEMYDIAAREAGRLERLTSDFLSYAKPRHPELTHCSIRDLLEYVATACRAHAHDRGVRITVEALASLEADLDETQMHQALLNLVMNAVDASVENGTVYLRADCEAGWGIRLDVENSGPQIAADHLPRIFEPFFSTRPGGTGLGLAIARNIAVAHCGELLVTANTPQRVCFSLMVPTADVAVAHAGA